MPVVVGIKFDRSPKIYYFEAGQHEYVKGGGVIVETARGIEYGTVSLMPKEVAEDKIVPPLKPVTRIANEDDQKAKASADAKRRETYEGVRKKVEDSGLKMKLVDVEYTFDSAKLIVYFTADGRVDFRELVRELASMFRTRIELRQIGARDECRMKGGIAPCGRACCCSDHIPDFPHVTIKMAKNQNLSLNPAKISGLCGRLMCCLNYENAHYVETNKKMPRAGSEVTLSDGRKGIAISINQLKETVRVKTEHKDMVEFLDVALADIKFKGKGSAADETKDDIPDVELKGLED